MDDLYNPDNIGSILKSWLRELPTQIMPKERQKKLAEELEKDNPEYQKIGQPTPQKLRDALSDLPPFNYYLLFAVTCHLSLLLSHKEKNKMDLNNLSICIGPCLELDRWLFNYLVGDWRHCWQGCFTEKLYLEGEKAYEEGREYTLPSLPIKGPVSQETQAESEFSKLAVDERAVHSSDSNISPHASRQGSQQDDATLSMQGSAMQVPNENAKPITYQPAGSPRLANGSVSSLERKHVATQDTRRPTTANAGENSPTSATANSSTPKPKERKHNRSQSDLPLSPIKPVSPMDFSFQVRGQ